GAAAWGAFGKRFEFAQRGEKLGRFGKIPPSGKTLFFLGGRCGVGLGFAAGACPRGRAGVEKKKVTPPPKKVRGGFAEKRKTRKKKNTDTPVQVFPIN
ncbi:hypothetical protein DNR41_27155, partial [Escherichia coli]|uniref:hypothetical protein n=1 Tax=Escherichia coli TaxID=562 RepID=UPI000DBC41F6